MPWFHSFQGFFGTKVDWSYTYENGSDPLWNSCEKTADVSEGLVGRRPLRASDWFIEVGHDNNKDKRPSFRSWHMWAWGQGKRDGDVD